MDEDIRQRDLSGKRVDEMTAAERREMKRRFEEFFQQMRALEPSPTPAPRKRVRKWNPQIDAGRKPAVDG